MRRVRGRMLRGRLRCGKEMLAMRRGVTKNATSNDRIRRHKFEERAMELGMEHVVYERQDIIEQRLAASDGFNTVRGSNKQ